MLRRAVLVGDPPSSGGAVLPHAQNKDTVRGISFAYVGGAVQCNGYNSIGTIAKAGGPYRLPYRGGEVALENDIVLCKCRVPPTLIAKAISSSPPDVTVDDCIETLGMIPQIHTGGGAASAASRVVSDTGWNNSDAADTSNKTPAAYNLHFLVKDDKTGKPLSGIPYKITLATGEEATGITNASGLTKTIGADTPVIAKLKAPYYGNSTSNTHTHDEQDTCSC